MAWRLVLGSRLAVQRDGKDCGQPPNATVAVLLVGLSGAINEGLDRNYVAAELYPRSDAVAARIALRKSLQRLRDWLGADSIDSEGRRVRLSPSRWTIEPDLAAGAKLTTNLLVGVEHPWLDRLRHVWSGNDNAAITEATRGFVAAVRGAAHADVVAARSILVAGAAYLVRLSPREAAQMFAITRPASSRDHLALEHLELQNRFHHFQLEFEEASGLAIRAMKIAVRSRNRAAVSRISAELAFNCIEQGDMSQAQTWLTVGAEDSRQRSTVWTDNCHAAWLWNSGNLFEASSAMARGRGQFKSADRTSRLHYLSNYSVLAAESGETNLSAEIAEEAAAIAIPDFDMGSCFNLMLAKARRLICRREYAEAVQLLQRLERSEAPNPLGATYAREALAEALALMGRGREALNVWTRAESARGGRQNPRRLAQRQRVMAGSVARG